MELVEGLVEPGGRRPENDGATIEGKVIVMFSTRSSQYWVWFLLLGVVSILADYSSSQSISAEALWLLLAGLGGIIVGSFKSFTRPYDLFIGFLFTTMGVIGILHSFGIVLVSGNSSTSQALATGAVMGLSLILPYALIHMLIGLSSLTHGVKLGRTSSSVVVNTPVSTEA
jgi:hypothetical protein